MAVVEPAFTGTEQNRRVAIASLPDGPLETSDFVVEDVELPSVDDDRILCRTLAITIGAGQRAGLQGSASYAGAPEVGKVMGGSGIAQIVAGEAPGLAIGDLVRAPTGWQTFSTHRPQHLELAPSDGDLAHLLGPLGTNGLTAYFGLFDVGEVQPGDTVLVSAAGGSVGHLVGQMAKAVGARVVGVAGSDAKCTMLTEQLSFDAAINRRSEAFRSELKAATPDRVDVYFDNTGGPILESALFRMAVKGRIVCCGAASQYDTTSPSGGPRGVPGLLVNNRVKMQGFLVFDYESRYEEAREKISSWIDGGEMVPETTTYRGLETAPQAFINLLAGTTIGTTVVTVE